jgi:ribosomal protein L11 methyltransferase
MAIAGQDASPEAQVASEQGDGRYAPPGAVLGASAAVGVDIDEWSYDNAVENVELNRVEDRVKILQGDLSSLPPERFDMIVANIQLNVIDRMLPDMRERLNTGGVLLLSGLLLIDREHILRALSGYGFTVSEETKENEWLALAARLT